MGAKPVQDGVDPAYLQLIEDRTVEAVKKADAAAKPATGEYGTADDPTLLRDSREPHVPDGVLRTVKILGADKKPAGLIVQWELPPRGARSENKLLTADFIWQTIKRLEEKYHCPAVYFSGAVGGLMTTPSDRYRDSRKNC